MRVVMIHHVDVPFCIFQRRFSPSSIQNGQKRETEEVGPPTAVEVKRQRLGAVCTFPDELRLGVVGIDSPVKENAVDAESAEDLW